MENKSLINKTNLFFRLSVSLGDTSKIFDKFITQNVTVVCNFFDIILILKNYRIKTQNNFILKLSFVRLGPFWNYKSYEYISHFLTFTWSSTNSKCKNISLHLCLAFWKRSQSFDKNYNGHINLILVSKYCCFVVE